jgi:hypothetical protein
MNTPLTTDQLARLLDLFHAGLEAERSVLRQLASLADLQRDLTAARDFDAFHQAADTRDTLTRSFVTLEEGLRPIRRQIERHHERVRRLPGFSAADAVQKDARAEIARILSTDRASLDALAEAEVARRAVMMSLERGEATLGAYRRTLSPPVTSAVLMDRRG